MNDEFAMKLMEMVATAKQNGPCMSLHVSTDGQAVELLLDTSANTYSDWIKGEGADIGLIRDMDTNRVLGVRLPLYQRKLMVSGDDFETVTIDTSGEREW